jgi:hypothetical protein
MARNAKLLTLGLLGGSAAFSPLTISGLALWLDASDASTLFQADNGTTPAAADADPVGYWGDKSGNGRHVTQSTAGSKGTLKTSIQNGRNIVRFDGGDVLTRASVTIAQPCTVFVVGASTTNDGIVIGGAATIGMYRSAALKLCYQAGNFISGTVSVGTSFFIGAAVFNGASSQLITNGTVASTSNPGAGGFGAVGVGAYSNGANKAACDVGEILIYSAALSDASLTAMIAYLNTRWSTF